MLSNIKQKLSLILEIIYYYGENMPEHYSEQDVPLTLIRRPGENWSEWMHQD